MSARARAIATQRVSVVSSDMLNCPPMAKHVKSNITLVGDVCHPIMPLILRGVGQDTAQVPCLSLKPALFLHFAT